MTAGNTSRRGATSMTPVRFSDDETNGGNNLHDSSSPDLIQGNSRSSGGLGHGKRKLSFFGYLFNLRSGSDQPNSPPAPSFGPPTEYRKGRSNSGGGTFPGGVVAAASVSSGDEDAPAAKSRIQQCFSKIRSYTRPSKASLDRLSSLITSKIWQILLVFFTILLLFGGQFQELWVPKEWDTVFNVLFTVALGFFALEIIIRCYTEPQYFEFNLCGKTGGDAPAAWGSCRLGSFMFWCDLLSSSTLLFDISFVNTRLFDVETIDIDLDLFGLPIGGLEEINSALPVQLELELLVTIARTARVARFIRASTVVKTSSKVNWYWLYERISPTWCLKKLRGRNSSHDGSPGSLDQDANDPEGFTSKNRDAHGGTRQASWGRLQWGVLTAVKKAQMYDERRTTPREPGFRGAVRRILRAIRLMRTDDEELRRQVAATKIQRAWRAMVNQHRHESVQGTSEDVAWAPSREFTADPADSAVQKRSLLRSYNSQSSHALKAGNSGRKNMLPISVKNHIQARSNVGRRRPESQVGSAMRELTGQRVAIGIIIALVLTVLFTYSENDATRPSTMIVLHNQTMNEEYAAASLNAARDSSIPDLYQYVFANGTVVNFTLVGENPEQLRDREVLQISIVDASGLRTVGLFAYRNEMRDEALVEFCSTVFILLVWFFGVTAFAGPVMTLVVVPIERMVRLLGMLMLDPLGYQSTPRYKKFVAEEDELTKNTRWTKEVLKGMETSFLMSTILRIGSLMKVGFGSAGVEIIRNSLEPGQSKNMLILDSKGSTVSCIFLFCDIRQFTDATECLQEEVFVFTNKIAAVVHSICHAYGGSANKNIGDAFLLSWLLEDEAAKVDSRGRSRPSSNQVSFASGANNADTFTAKTNQADKALLSVVKICMALRHDKFYIETMSETAREALLAKLSKRKGPVVQMGFGLHAGKAVQGAIGSQRKIDATYVSESVERAEFLESSTKKYGLKMLMSDSFHRLLHPSNRRRCRKIDQILLQNDEDDDDEAGYDEGDVMELFTFDMDIDALWKISSKKAIDNADSGSDTESINESTKGSKREIMEKKASSTRHATPAGLLKGPRRKSMNRLKPNVVAGDTSTDEPILPNSTITEAATIAAAASAVMGSTEFTHEEGNNRQMAPDLILPTGPTLYNANVWLSEDMRKIRELFSDGLFFQKFNSGLQSYYARDWEHAKQCFQTILERFDDGPSRYFLKCIQDNNGVPPRHFPGYGSA